jgi:DNA-binding response OmpR family regulator
LSREHIPVIAFVIDSGRGISDLVHEVLDDAGWRVEVATDGIAALGRVRRMTPDVILFDGAMPHPASLAVLGALRSEFHDGPILLLAFGDVPADVLPLVDAVLPESFGRGALLQAISALELGVTTG